MAWSQEVGRQFRAPRGALGWLMGWAMAVMNRRPYRLAIDAAGIRAGDHVLDLGCGPGAAFGWQLARGADQVTGVDASPAMVEFATSRNITAVGEGRVAVHEARFDSLPFADCSFDCILAVNVAYFWGDTATAVLSELKRVLRDDGRLSVYVTDAETMRHWAFAGPETHRWFDAEKLRRTLTDGGFSVQTLVRTKVMPGVIGLVALCHREGKARAAAFG